jgi:curved DNA-binding protein
MPGPHALICRREPCDPLARRAGLARFGRMESSAPDHYRALGLDRHCTAAQIRDAYRTLVKRNHPDLNRASSEAVARTQELNAAHEILSDPRRRRAYDLEIDAADRAGDPGRRESIAASITQDLFLRIDEMLRGTRLTVRVKDPANPHGAEAYELAVPDGTAPGARFRIPRAAPFENGFVMVRVKPRPDFRFKVRGSDLRSDLRISASRAAGGGVEMIAGPDGSRLQVLIPRGVGRGAIIRLKGGGLPKARGGRGDLLVRIAYRAEVGITRGPRR